MKKRKIITREEALAQARAEKDTPETVGHVFYHLLEHANPAMVEMFEKMLVDAIQVGDALRCELESVEPDSPEYHEYTRMMHNVVNSGIKDPDVEKLKKDIFDAEKKGSHNGE